MRSRPLLRSWALPASTALLAGAVATACGAGPSREAIDEAVRRTLEERVGVAGFGGRVFCAHRSYGTEHHADTIRVYVWALCAEYYRRGTDPPTTGTGISVPVAVDLVRDGATLRGVRAEQPGDGDRYGPDIRRIFPFVVRVRMLAPTTAQRRRGRELADSVRALATAFYGVAVRTESPAEKAARGEPAVRRERRAPVGTKR